MPGGRDKPGSTGTGGAERRRYALPTDLSGSLGHLDDDQFDRLLQAVIEEARRRGRRIAGDHTPSRASGSANPIRCRPHALSGAARWPVVNRRLPRCWVVMETCRGARHRTRWQTIDTECITQWR